ncbi:MAG: cysteine desulfurase family protein [Polyangiaceae bacterium]
MRGDPIYLDHNATTPLLPEVVDAMIPFLREHFGNPSSGHVYGERARAAVEDARARVAEAIGARADEIVFTSGGTEANNLAIRGVAERSARRGIVSTAVEHPATRRPCEHLAARGFRWVELAVDARGVARIEDAKAAIDGDVALVTVMHSNNETGSIQPVEELAALARSAGARVHSDAAQSIGKVPIDVDALDVDLLSIAGHKLYAPKGVGALFVRRGTPIAPFALGAGHEHGLRPGTENVASIVGLGVACARVTRDLADEAPRVRGLRDALFSRLASRIPELALNGHPEARLPNTLNVRFPRVSGSALIASTPEVAASTGSACHGADERASAVILAMGVDPVAALGSVRLTLGRGTTMEDVERAADALANSWSVAVGAS